MFEKLKLFWALPDLRKRVLYTLLLLVLIRILAHIPIPGINTASIKQFFASNQIFGLFDMFSGGAMSRFSIIMMGVGPYITASIVLQLLTMVVPSLEALSKEGPSGQQTINQYTRYLTVPLAFIQAYAMITYLKNTGLQAGLGQQLAVSISGLHLVYALIIITAGTMLLMWLGELITENGIGNGISLIITLGIISRTPTTFRNTVTLIFGGGVVDYGKVISVLIFGVLALLSVAFIIYMNEGTRNIPVSYAKRIRGSQVFGGVDSHLPLRVNQAGVIPIILAMSLMLFPGTIAQFLSSAKSVWLAHFASYVAKLFQNNVFYGIIYFLLIIGFTYFYTNITFNPKNIAENLQKQGGFIPGVRPGNQTENYLKMILSRITLTGALFLALIAVLPFLMQAITKVQTLVIGGTSVLIVVSVVLETMRQVQSQLVMHQYDRY